VSKLIQLVLRFGPLVAGLALAVQAVLPASGDAIAQQVVNFLGLFGASPDLEVVDAISKLSQAALLALGYFRKLANIFAEYLGKAPFFVPRS